MWRAPSAASSQGGAGEGLASVARRNEDFLLSLVFVLQSELQS